MKGNIKMKLFLSILLFSLLISKDFKNVQVLDIASKKEMKKYMKSISKDLGAKCKDCHDMDDKSLDNPVKDIAREMIVLTRRINDVLLSIKDEKDTQIGKITCWTCHKGKFEVEHTRPEKE